MKGDPTCSRKYGRKKGEMFWGCFYGDMQGLGIFWEERIEG